MAKQFKGAPEADSIVATLLVDVHDHLIDFPIRCIFQDEADKAKGRLVLANIRKLTGLQAFMAGTIPAIGLQECLELDLPVDFDEPCDLLLICISYPHWEQMNEAQRVALIDHELCHARTVEDEKTGDRKVVLVGHDVEEFHAVAKRHGDWLGQLAGLGVSASSIVAVKKGSSQEDGA